MIKIAKCLILLFALSSCGWQSIPQSKNEVEAKLAEVTNQYKRRADLIPGLVKVVKAYADHEKETLTAVIEARANASKVNINADNLNAATMKQFQQAQGSLSSALGKLMVVVEKYPNLKANQNFMDLQAQLEGTENRITVARNRYIESIKQYNNLVTVPPTSWTNSLMYKFEKLPQFTVENAKSLEEPPKIDL